jgi:outer membrane receptor protein involved in Fe transport
MARPPGADRSLTRGGVVFAAALAIFAADLPLAHAQVAEVVVTARKREENVQNIPVAVTAISGDQVQQYNLSSVQDVQEQTPQLIIAKGSSGSGADISMRGIGASSENIGIEQSVAVNVDGVYYGQGRAIEEGLFDVSGVQVLKGPQALFYGKNATAGAIAILTNDPTSHYDFSLATGYEFYAQQVYVEGVASGPVSDKFGLRLAFRYADAGSGLFRNIAGPGVYNTTDIGTTPPTPHANPTAIPSGYIGGDKDALVRLTAKWTPTDALSVTLKGTFDSHRTNNNVTNAVDVYCPGPGGVPQSEAGLLNATPCAKTFDVRQPALPLVIANTPHALESLAGGQDFDRYQEGNVYLRINYTQPNYTLTSTNSFQHLFNDWADNQNFTNAAAVYAGEHFTWDQASSEERFDTTFHFPLNFAGGFYFQTTTLHFNQDVDFLGAQNSAAPPLDQYVAYNKLSVTTGHTYAVFGQAIWDIIPNLELTGGARYTHETKHSYFQQPYVNQSFPFNFLFIQYNPANPVSPDACGCNSVGAHQTFDNVSPEVTLTWKPVHELTLYGAYKTGYKSGGFSNSAILSIGTLASDFQFKPETSKGFEVGVKSLLFDNQLRLNADVFDFLYSNLQVDFFNTPTFNYITLNAASARTYGVELQADYAPRSIAGLVLHFDGSYNNSHYGTFEAPCSPAGITYEQGCNAVRVVNPGGSYTFSPNCGASAANLCNFMNVNGQPTALAPRWTAVIGGDYSHNISSALKAGLSLNVRVSSDYITNGFPSIVTRQVDRQPSYGTLDAVLYLASLNGHWEASVIGRNLTNTFIMVGEGGAPLSGGTTGCMTAVCGPQLISDQLGTVLNPRTVALQLKYKY